ncbi:MAG: GNAT family N-acetyltransferase [Anaerolineales bacterium]|nr:GNAT family N-acetyltransferase [Anaerolineales bacterium]
MHVRPLTPSDYDDWHALIRLAPPGNAFQRADWLQMLCATDLDLQLLLLGCYDDKQTLVGGQALLFHRRWGMSLSAPHEFFYNAPLVRPSCSAKSARPADVVAALVNATAHALSYAQVETHPALADVRPYLDAGWQVTPTYTHLWPMADPDQVWQAMNREKRREIRRISETHHFGVEEGDAVLDAFLALYALTMRKFSWRPSPKWAATFRQRFHWLRARDGCRLHTVRTSAGELVGGVVTLLSREDHTAYLWRQGSADPRVVPALYWFAANEVAGTFHTVNFGGSPQPSLSRFKDYLGATAVSHFRATHDASRGRLALFDRALAAKHAAYNTLMALGARRLLHGRRVIRQLP